jgi:signal transduction histidine kinase
MVWDYAWRPGYPAAGADEGISTSAAGMRLARSPNNAVEERRAWRTRIGDLRPVILAGVGGCAVLATIPLRLQSAIVDPRAQATIAASLVICAVTTAWLRGSRFRRTRRLRDLLVLAAVAALALMDLELFAGPAMLGTPARRFDAAAPTSGRILVAALLVAAAFSPNWRIVRQRSLSLRLRLAPALVLVGLGIGALIINAPTASTAAPDPRAFHSAWWYVATTLAAAVVTVLAGAGFARTASRERDGMAGACILLAASWTYSVAIPVHVPDAVFPGVGLTIASYVLLLVAAVCSRTQLTRAAADQAIMDERHRLAADLHDGLAQDLAFIAAHGERLAGQPGEEHPVAIAARRALAVTRGAMVDLAASDAPTPAAALEAVAAELAHRHGVRIEVHAHDIELGSHDRQELVRIAREAIVNGIRHGQADEIVVALRTRGAELALTVEDDGCGVREREMPPPKPGFGLRTMRKRTHCIGGQLTVQPGEHGGTHVEVVLR